MNRLREIPVYSRSVDRFEPIVGEAHLADVRSGAGELRRKLAGRTIWTVNSTAAGGGVAEMHRALLGYCRDMGIETRWLVVSGPPEFFRLTKRIHNALHGSEGDASPLGGDEHRTYESVLDENVSEMNGLVRPGDVVILHDPQTAGMISPLVRRGATVIWRCHIGGDFSQPEVLNGWEFLRPYLPEAHAFIFSRRQYAPPFCDDGRTVIIHPAIDPFSAKNQEMNEATVRSILVHTGLLGSPDGHAAPLFVREDGTLARVVRRASLLSEDRPPLAETPLVVQVSRWDHLKDPIGVLTGFARLANGGGDDGPELVLAGPSVEGVADDPEGAAVFDSTVEAWRGLPPEVRRKIHLATIPMDDLEENAAIVNALQRQASVVVQKSLQEGFGLTVTEAMWKGRPVIASAVGGIRDQIEDGVHGLLVPDPADLDAFASAVSRALGDADLSARLRESARRRVREQFLGLRVLGQYAVLIGRLIS
jgi:trehalose synthase